MGKKEQRKNKLRIADDSKTPSEIHSIILKGVICTLKTMFLSYYVSENIEALMKYINEKKIISAEEYKRLLYEAKDFYPVIICALFINPIKKHTRNFRDVEISAESKKLLFDELYEELNVFFSDWLCDIEADPLLFYRLAVSYNKPFTMDLSIKQHLGCCLTAIEEQVLKLQYVEIICLYAIEQVAIHLGLAGLDYIDCFKVANISESNNTQEIIQV
ncbi:MAG: hypothetical protein ACM3TR_20045 [Caulobacteraceae bacterium]